MRKGVKVIIARPYVSKGARKPLKRYRETCRGCSEALQGLSLIEMRQGYFALLEEPVSFGPSLRAAFSVQIWRC